LTLTIWSISLRETRESVVPGGCARSGEALGAHLESLAAGGGIGTERRHLPRRLDSESDVGDGAFEEHQGI